MADSSQYTKPHFTLSQANSPIRPKSNINNRKSYSGFLFKSLLFALFVVLLPLFPSQAPEFVNQTIITQLWELLHLLFIGIAVAYGLFCRRNVDPDLEIENLSIVDNTSCFASTMFPVSSVFSDEGENPCGYDENRMMMMHCNWNYSQYYESNALMVMDEQYKPQLPPPEDNFSDVRYDGTNVVQAWNSEYNHRQPMVVVAHPYYTIGESDEIVGYKPLGLPVRSLRSTVGDLDSPGNTNESDSSSGSRGSSRSSVKSRDRKFGDLGPYDSDQNFNDAAGSASPDTWRSRSRKMKIEGNHGVLSDATASASIPWQERSERLEIEENYGEFNNVAGSASPIPWRSRSRRMKNEENCGKFSDATAPASSIPWLERSEGFEIEENHGECNNVAPWRSRSRRMKIEENRGKFSDAAASASYITWQEESKGVEAEEKDGETDDVAGSASPIPWEAMSSWMESEGNHEKFDDVGSSSIQWEENFRRMELEENQRDFAESASPISWQTMSQAMESEENHRIFNDASGSAFPIQWYSRSKRMESEENHSSITHPLHHRPLSAAETKSESFNSQAFQSTTSLSSHRSTYSSDSVSSDNINLESEEMGQKKIFDGSSSDIMNFQEEDSGANMAYRGSSPRLKKMGTRENYAIVSHQPHFGSSSEKINLQEEDSGANMAARGSPPRLRKMATWEKYGTVSRPSHFRPMSVDETQFESLGSRSFKSTGSFTSRTSLLSSLDSVPSENLNLPKGDLGENKSSRGPSSSSSPSPPVRRTEEASSQAFHSRGYSVGSLLQDGLKSSLKDEWIDLNGSEDQSHNKNAGLHLQSDTEKHGSLAKAPTRGKSVRTRRTSGPTPETMRTGDMCSKQTDEKVEKMLDNVEPVLIRREKLRKEGPDHPSKVINKQSPDEKVEKMPDNDEPVLIRREKLGKRGPDHPSKVINKQSTHEKVEKMPDNDEPVLIRREKLRKGGSGHPSRGVSKQNTDCPCPNSEGTFSSYPKRDKEEPSKDVAKEDLLIEPENSKMSSDEDRMSECVNDSGLDSEVDKKASEFIAKFKAQIRLQKEVSMDRSRGLKTMKRVLGDT